MTLARILQLFLLVITAFLMLAVGVWFQKCRSDRELDKRPPAEIEADDVEEGEPDADLGIRTIYVRELAPSRRGTAPKVAAAEVDSFVAAVADTTDAPPLYVPFAGRHEKDDTLTLWVPRSDGSKERIEFPDCDRPCDFGSTPAGGPYAHSPRTIPRLLPDLGRTALVCGGAAAAGWGVAYLAEYERPELVAGALGGGCVVLKILN